MKVKTLINKEYFSSNIHLYFKNNHVLIIDLGFFNDELVDSLKGYIIDGVIITHKHFDHIYGLEKFNNEYPKVNIYSRLENMDYFDDVEFNCSYMSESKLTYKPNNLIHLIEGENKIGPFNLNIIYTQGHTDDLICIIDEDSKVMFSGDFIFLNAIGRCDLKTGNMLKMFKSIDKVFPMIKLKEYVIYSGHDENSFTSKDLLANNVYFKRKNR